MQDLREIKLNGTHTAGSVAMCVQLFCGAELPGAQEPAPLPCLEPVKQTLIRSNSSQVTNGLTAFGSDKPLGVLNPADLHTLTQDCSAAFAGTFH